jgi:hypothetical protein
MMDSIEVKQALQGLAAELVEARRGAKVKIVYTVSGLYMNLRSTCFIYRTDLQGEPEGLIVPVTLPHSVIHLAAYIRENCYVPDRGTWYSMVYTLNADNSAEIVLNFDDEPLYRGQSFEPDQYALELLKFPVAEGNRTAWLKKKLLVDTM